MNELMITLLENNWFLYAACGAAGTGGLIQIVLTIIYNRSLNASDRMRNTKVVWLRQMKTRYESGYEWNNRIRNVELFVDKNMGRRKWLGIYLKTWEEFGKMMLPLTLVFALLGAVCAGTYTEDRTLAVSFLAVGTVLAVLLRGIAVLANLKEKQTLLRTNLCDYFENTLRAEAGNRRRERKEQEEYFEIQKKQEEIACTLSDADGGNEIAEPTTGESGERQSVSTEESAVVQSQQKAEKAENKKQKKEMKKNAKETKQLKKQEKKTEKETAKLRRKQMKEQKRVDKLTKRMEKMQQRLGTAATAEGSGAQSTACNKKEENARLKREQLKRKVDVTPAQEDQILSEVLREFLA